jgi:hypothetical protein
MHSILMQASWLDRISEWFGPDGIHPQQLEELSKTGEQRWQERKQRLLRIQEQQRREQERIQEQQRRELIQRMESLTDEEKDILSGANLYDQSEWLIKDFYRLIKYDKFNDFIALIPFAKAAAYGQYIVTNDIFMYWFQHGIPNTKFGKGTTPLHVAAFYGRPLFVNYFIKLLNNSSLSVYKKNWLNATTANGYTALDFAMVSQVSKPEERANCIQLLRRAGAENGKYIKRKLEENSKLLTLTLQPEYYSMDLTH